MITVDDLDPNQPIPGSIVVEVTAVRWNPADSRRARVELVDSAGNSLQLLDYDGADLSTVWKSDHRYRITHCRVTKGDGGLQLTPSKRTNVDRLGKLEGVADLLVLGDTHIGRNKHPKTGEKTDPLSAFITAIKEGIKRDVDAVIHVGDIFHESATPAEIDIVQRDILNPLQEAGIPFYFVKGNHISELGLEMLEDSIGSGVVPLDLTGAEIHPEICLYGLDYQPMGNIDWPSIEFPDTMDESISILFLHQTLEQLSGFGPKSVDIGYFEQRAPEEFQFVLSGHHHDSVQDRWKGIPVMYTGAAERMSTNKDSVDRVAWFLHAESGSVSRERYDIPED